MVACRAADKQQQRGQLCRVATPAGGWPNHCKLRPQPRYYEVVQVRAPHKQPQYKLCCAGGRAGTPKPCQQPTCSSSMTGACAASMAWPSHDRCASARSNSMAANASAAAAAAAVSPALPMLVRSTDKELRAERRPPLAPLAPLPWWLNRAPPPLLLLPWWLRCAGWACAWWCGNWACA